MKRYSKVDEESVRIYSAVREWARSGLLGKEQGAALAREVQPPLKRTNTFLRAVLFFLRRDSIGIGVAPTLACCPISHNGVVKMEYLFVVVALASAGFVFAGLKKGIGRNEKKITRLEL